jgi:hypothetical protein
MTCNFFLSFRTHVLPCDAEGNILDWDYLDFHRCSYEEELLQSHEEMCKKWENATISGDGKTL